MQIERIERLPIPLRQPIQYFPLLLHSKMFFTKIRNYLHLIQQTHRRYDKKEYHILRLV